jgi:hypothetical protein
MNSGEILAGEWLELFQTKTSKPLNNKGFQAKYNTIDSKYRKLPMAAQDEFTKAVHKKVREIIR